MAATKQGRVKREIDWQSSVPEDVLDRIVTGIKSGLSRSILYDTFVREEVPPPTYTVTVPWTADVIGQIFCRAEGFKTMADARKKYRMTERLGKDEPKVEQPKHDEGSAAVTPGSVVVREGKQPEAGKDLAGPAKVDPKPEGGKKRGRAKVTAKA